MKKLAKVVGILIGVTAIVATLVSLLGTDQEWIFRVGVAVCIGLACVGIFAVLRDRSTPKATKTPQSTPSAFGRGDFSGSTIEGNRSSAEQFLDATARDATIRNNTHEPGQR